MRGSGFRQEYARECGRRGRRERADERRPLSQRAFAGLLLFMSAFVTHCGTADVERGEDEDIASISSGLCDQPTLTITPGSPAPKAPITLTGAASCAAGEVPEYQFSVQRIGADTSWQLLRAYDPSPSVTWDASDAPSGKYRFLLEVRRQGFTARDTSTVVSNYLFGDVCDHASLSKGWRLSPIDPAPPRLAASSRCLGAAQPEYQFRYRPSGTTEYQILRDWGPPIAHWSDLGQVPAGRYDVTVRVRAIGNTSDFEASDSAATFLVGETCSAATLDFYPRSPQVAGTSIALTASARCDEGVVPEYKFVYKLGSAWVTIREWDSSPVATWDTTGLGVVTPQVNVRVRAAGNATESWEGLQSHNFPLQARTNTGTCTGTLGDNAYCADCLCALGEGHCASGAECAPGLVCAATQGAKFGQAATTAVCVPAHCTNGVQDTQLGETGPDCGINAGCGECLPSCEEGPRPLGDTNFCLGCLCAAGEGDCDFDGECGHGLVCGTRNGARFGFSTVIDVCVPPHCTNDFHDEDLGEDGIDCGGPCGACLPACSGPAGDNNFCYGCSCTTGQGDCDADRDCALGLVCADDQGARFGIGSATDVCLPSHCTNDFHDEDLGEQSVDCGGPCGPCLPACLGTPGAEDFCIDCVCTHGQADCDSHRECAPGLFCALDVGAQFGFSAQTDVCVAGGPAGAQEPLIYEVVDGRAVAEAEQYTSLELDSDAPIHDWQVNAAPASGPYSGASGAAYMQTTPDAGTAQGRSPPGLLFRIRVPAGAEGNYVAYVRATGPDGAGNSVHILVTDLSGNPVVANAEPQFTDQGAWSWGGSSGMALGAGDYFFHVNMREDGVAVDKIVLQLAPLAPPTDAGPAPTPIVPCGSSSVFHVVDGIGSAESENYSARPTDSAEPIHEWLQEIAPGSGAFSGASDGAFMTVGPDVGTFEDPSPARLLYRFRIPQAAGGEYVAYVRGSGPNTDGDSVLVSITTPDGTLLTPQTYAGLPGNGTWSWLASTPATLAPGEYVVQLTMGEDGAAIDKVVLQLASLAAPANLGPLESPLAVPAPDPSCPDGGEPTCEPGAPATDSCPGQAGSDCSNGPCAEGLVCDAMAGAYYDKPGVPVCRSPACEEHTHALGCGDPHSPCGHCKIGCDSDEDCSAGEVCGNNNGVAFGSPFPNVCEPTICATDAEAGGCGYEGAPCGMSCGCTPNCSGKTCGDDPSDGCGSFCPGICPDHQPGCTRNTDCQPGSSCVQQGGVGVCVNSKCQNPGFAAANCGDIVSLCGPCPACTPDCSGRECGVDPVCGQSCGGPCSEGNTCSVTGQCVPGTANPPVLVPDGTGGSKEVAPLANPPTSVAGALEGSFAVSDRGTSTYTIPIVVPPGRGGLEPNLSLRYEGNVGNGHLGLGWKLEGLSAITRCSRTRALDGGFQPIRHDDNDRFCMDGKRLVLVDGVYGMDSAEYRTVIDSFSKVVSERSSGELGPSRFKVSTKDGKILWFGHQPANVAKDGKGVPYTWLLDRVEDRAGNYLTVQYARPSLQLGSSYDVSPATGPLVDALEIYPSSIRYTGFDRSTGGRSVSFTYEPREDAIFGYRPGGAAFKTTVRLKQITTHSPDQEGRAYRLSYELSPQRKSRISKVTECPTGAAPDSDCRTPTTFEYYDNELGFEPGGSIPARRGVWLDSNGDGLKDLLETTVKVNQRHVTERTVVNLSMTAASFFVAPQISMPIGFVYGFLEDTIWGGPDVSISRTMYLAKDSISHPYNDGGYADGLSCSGTQPSYVIDIDNDGRDDIVERCPKIDPSDIWEPRLEYVFRQSSDWGQLGYSFRGNETLFSLSLSEAGAFMFFDLDGDDLKDALYCSSGHGGFQYRLKLPGTSGFAPPQAIPAFGGDCTHLKRRMVMDVDADGRLDLLVNAEEQIGILEFAGPASTWRTIRPRGSWQYYGPTVGDFNGDGLADLLILRPCLSAMGHCQRPNPSELWINTGGDFAAVNLDETAFMFNMPVGVPPLSIDIDQDGTNELMHLAHVGLWRPYIRRLGNDGQTLIGQTVPGPELETGMDEPMDQWTLVHDVNGDGMLDLFVPQYHNGPLDIYYGKGTNNGLLKRVTDGVGNFVELDYSTGNNIYGLDEYFNTKVERVVYRPKSGACPTGQRCLRTAPSVVIAHREGRQVGGNSRVRREFEYSYEDARLDLNGHGWLGFASRTVSEPSRGITTITYADWETAPLPGGGYVYPTAGLVKWYTVLTPENPGPLTGTFAWPRRIWIDTQWGIKTSADGLPFVYAMARNTQVTEGGGWVTRVHEGFEVDDYGNVISEVNEEGDGTPQNVPPPNAHRSVTTTEYYPHDRNAWLVALPRRRTVSSERNGFAKARVTEFTYQNGLLESVERDPDGTGFTSTARLHRDPNGNVRRAEIQAGGEVRGIDIDYDNTQVFPIRFTNDLGHVEQVRYDTRTGAMTLHADPNGIVHQWAIDAFGRPTTQLSPTETTSITYARFIESSFSVTGFPIEPTTLVTTVTSTGDRVEQYLDSIGRPVRTVTRGLKGQDVEQEFAYDVLDRLVKATRPHPPGDASQNEIRYEYDSWDRLTHVQHPDGTVERTDYASSESLDSIYFDWLPTTEAVEVVRTTDGKGHQNVTVYDRFGNPLRSIDGNNAEQHPEAMRTTDYLYGEFNQLKQITDNLGNETTIHHDTYGRIVSRTDPSTGATAYSHTAFDEVATAHDANDRLTTFEYDVLGRLEQMVDASGTTTWDYDGPGPNEIGRLVSMTAPSTANNPAGHRVRYTYTPPTPSTNHGLPETVTYELDSHTFITSLEYNAHGQLQRIRYPQAAGQQPVIEYSYDGPHLDAVHDVSTQPALPLWRVTGAEGHRIQQVTFGNNTTSTFGYEQLTGFLTSINTAGPTSSIQNLSYTYYGNGLIQSRLDALANPNPRQYHYDALNRLTDVLQQSGQGQTVQSFRYDSIGNFTEKHGVGTYSYVPGRPHIVQTAGENSYEHDDAGNQTARSGPDIPGLTQQLFYTPFDLPHQIVTGTGSTQKVTHFEYTAAQERVVKRAFEDGTLTATTYHAGDLYQRHIPAQGHTEHRYRVFAGGTQVAELIQSEDPAVPPKWWYLHTDHQGSVTAISDDAGAVHHTDFETFGARSGPSASILAGYTGHHHDDDLGLINMKGRLYDPHLGRFLTADPVVQFPFWSQGLNPYAYVHNNPINLTDPSGFTISTPTIREPYRSLAGPAWVAAWGGAAAAAASGGGGAAAGAGGGAVAGLSTSSMASGPPLGSGAIGGQLGLGIGRGLAGALNRRSPIQQIQPSAEQKATDMARGSSDATATSQGGEDLTWEPADPAIRQQIEDFQMYLDSQPDERLAGRGARRPRGAPVPGPWNSPVLRPIPRRPPIPLPGRVSGPARGFPSHRALVKHLGPAGPDMDWHHIVLQTPSNVSRFGPQQVHNTHNIVRIRRMDHYRIHSFYESIDQNITGSRTMRVREWIQQRPLEDQRTFGEAVLKMFGALEPL